VAALVSFLMLQQGLFIQAAIARVLGIGVLCVAFYIKRKWKSPLFYSSLIFSTIGEVLIQYGKKDFHDLILIVFSIYYWFIFFLVKRNIKEPKYKIKRDRLVPIIITVSFVFYLVISVFIFVFNEIANDLIFSIICIVAFLVAVFYMGFIYVNIRTVRNLWLLLAMIFFIVLYVGVPMEALLFPSNYLKGGIILVEVLSHFCIYKFLITPEYEIEPEDKSIYL